MDGGALTRRVGVPHIPSSFGHARLAAALVAACVLAGCTAPPTRYAWGSYEDQIYVVYSKPGTLTPEAQAEQLQKDRELARGANRPLPPGWRAHLAYVYTQMGRPDLASEELLAEKVAFPEATRFVDQLLTNMSVLKAPEAAPAGASAPPAATVPPTATVPPAGTAVMPPTEAAR